MCLIVYKEDDSSVFTNTQFKHMIRRNRDGLGIMWREDGRIRVEKTVGSEKAKFKLWSSHRNRPSYAMHARLTTHGKTNLENCHPYKILSIDDGDPIDLYMMHNGIIPNVPDSNKDMSDTWHLCEYVIKPIAKTNLAILWDDAGYQSWIQKLSGQSKLLFMRSDDVESPVLIFNMEAGKTENNCWLSNAYSTDTTHSFYNRSKPSTLANTGYNYYSGYGYTGGTTSKQNFTPATSQAMTSPISMTDACRKEETSKLYLPSPSNSVIIPTQQESDAVVMASLLQGMSTHSVKEWIKESPEDAADLIIELYKKNSMTYEMILAEIADERKIDGIVDLVRHIVSFKQ
jgi:predicted glutamine amidotransferase